MKFNSQFFKRVVKAVITLSYRGIEMLRFNALHRYKCAHFNSLEICRRFIFNITVKFHQPTIH